MCHSRVGAKLIVEPCVAFRGEEFGGDDMSLWGVEANSGVVGGVDGRSGWRQHGCEVPSWWGVPVGIGFLQEDLSVLVEFGGLRGGRGSWVGRGSSSLPGYLAGRRGGRSWCWEWSGVVGCLELCKVAVEGNDASGH